ncbi:MAG: glycoside hydrolase family 9 protein [Acidobacteria bacterium]|nr:glycoside hydrolase family 9 protein [Acidobacteriota bacterium]
MARLRGHGRRVVTGVGLLLALTGWAVGSGWEPARRIAVGAAGWPVRALRARRAQPPTSFAHLAATQLGLAPMGPKAFTSPARFTAFAVVDEETGATVYRSSEPPRAVTTDRLGTIDTVWIGDFAPVTRPGRYHLEADNGLSSHPFAIAPEAFDLARRAVQRVFYFQRAFTAIEARHAEGPWMHPSDAARAPLGVGGGWHDAGDYSIYNMTTVSSLFWLLEAYRDFAPADDTTNIPESGNAVPDLLDEARRGLEWLLAVQVDDGGFRNSTCVEAYAPYGRNPPEAGRPYVHGEVGTIATARAVGILGSASVVYDHLDAGFARRLREAAERGWRYLDARPAEHSDGPTCGAYRQDGDERAGRAARMFAAAGLLVATGEARFRDAFERHFVDIDDEPSPYRFGAYACLLYRRAAAADPARTAAIDARLATLASRIVAQAEAHPFAWTGRYVWGSLAIGFERAGLLIARCLANPEAALRDCRTALSGLDYAFGRNSLQFAYLSGLPGVTRGRQHAFHHWLATLDATPFVFPGAVAGGPNERPELADTSRPLAYPRPVWGYWGDPAMPRSAATAIDGRYTDNDSWSTNEVAIAWQGPALYNLYFGAWAARRGWDSRAIEMPAQALDDPSGGAPVTIGIGR